MLSYAVHTIYNAHRFNLSSLSVKESLSRLRPFSATLSDQFAADFIDHLTITVHRPVGTMDSSSVKASALDFLSAILSGKTTRFNKTMESYYYTGDAVAEVLMMKENREVLMILTTTSVAVLIGCVVALMWRRSRGMKKVKSVEQFLKPVKVEEPVVEVDDRRKKVVVFYGTQTGTAEGFAKVI